MIALIAGAGLLSFWFVPDTGRIALASLAAFLAAGLADAVMYHRLRQSPRFGGYFTRVNGSNAAGAATDSLLFPLLAFGAFMPMITLAQFAAKLAGGFVWALVLRRMLAREAQ